MTALGEYIAGHGEAPSRRELNRIIDRYEWFSTARRVRALVTGEVDAALTLPMMFWGGTPSADLATRNEPGIEALSPARHFQEPNDETTGNELIDRFIEHGGYRIAPEGEAPPVLVDIEIDPEMVTAELAEIYRSQGLTAEAEKIDRILKGNQNLRNS